MLKQVVLDGVAAAKIALQDLTIEGSLVTQTYPDHVPGTVPSSTQATYPIKVVIIAFNAKEVDNDRILATDMQGLVFPEVGMPVPKPNDILVVESKNWRVLNNAKTMAGNELALSTLQLRPT